MNLLNKKLPDLPKVPEEERTPLVDKLIEINSFQNEPLQLQKEVNQGLKDENARLKGEKPKPKINHQTWKKSQRARRKTSTATKSHNPHAQKRNAKTSKFITLLPFLRSIFLKAVDLKATMITLFKTSWIQPYNIRFRLERWKTPSGESIVGTGTCQ